MMAKGWASWGAWLYRRGENFIALMIGVMFIAFLLQVVFRYVLNWADRMEQ